MSPNARAQQPQWTYKYANNLPEAHPMNVRAREMAAAIKQETNGRTAVPWISIGFLD
jgi:TRAP-type C4-dicarboxylate transport system substrate-binding protein